MLDSVCDGRNNQERGLLRSDEEGGVRGGMAKACTSTCIKCALCVCVVCSDSKGKSGGWNYVDQKRGKGYGTRNKKRNVSAQDR